MRCAHDTGSQTFLPMRWGCPIDVTDMLLWQSQQVAWVYCYSGYLGLQPKDSTNHPRQRRSWG